MQIKKVKLVYFSATYTTRHVMRRIAAAMEGTAEEYDLTGTTRPEAIEAEAGDLFLFGAPVYAGRIPAQAAEAFRAVKAQHTPAAVVCVYGNRDYDDALLELKDLAEENGFTVLMAGAFVARHSIFPELAADRPDTTDDKLAQHFGARLQAVAAGIESVEQVLPFQVKGKRPYKNAAPIPLKPSGNRRCNRCGTCVRLCPARAIPEDDPKKTDRDKCFSCGRCVAVCPTHARHFGGLLYNMARKRIVEPNRDRKEPDIFATPTEAGLQPKPETR